MCFCQFVIDSKELKYRLIITFFIMEINHFIPEKFDRPYYIRNIVGGDVLNEVNEVIEKIKNGFKIVVTVFG